VNSIKQHDAGEAGSLDVPLSFDGCDVSCLLRLLRWGRYVAATCISDAANNSSG
jgi:hypothetical protein